jgi:hypothetical protein
MASFSDQPLRVAVVGLGFGVQVHVPALRACEGLEPVALWHPSPPRLAAACEATDLPGASSYEALLADPTVDALVLATPPEPRLPLARAALEAGKHLLLEKPVTLSAEDAADLQRLALQRGLTVAVDFEYRAVPLFQQLAQLLSQGAVGTPWLVKLDWLMSSRANPSRPWSWYSQASAGGGVIGALGTHAFDMLHWLVGPTRGMHALLSTAIRERPLPGDGRLAAVDAGVGAPWRGSGARPGEPGFSGPPWPGLLAGGVWQRGHPGAGIQPADRLCPRVPALARGARGANAPPTHFRSGAGLPPHLGGRPDRPGVSADGLVGAGHPPGDSDGARPGRGRGQPANL